MRSSDVSAIAEKQSGNEGEREAPAPDILPLEGSDESKHTEIDHAEGGRGKFNDSVCDETDI